MIELNSKIKNALIKIDFIKRYEELSNKFNAERTPSSNRLVYIEGKEVMETIQALGYSPFSLTTQTKSTIPSCRIIWTPKVIFPICSSLILYSFSFANYDAVMREALESGLDANLLDDMGEFTEEVQW